MALTVLYLTDIHARIERERREILPALRHVIRPPGSAGQFSAGLASMERLIVRAKEAAGTEPVVFINCGDLVGIEMVHDWAGGGLVTLAAIEAMVERAGIEHCFSVVGNHEMDHGINGFRRLKASASRFRFLAGNLTVDGNVESPTIEVVTVGGVRVALLALTVDLTKRDAPHDDRDRLGVAEPATVAAAALDRVRALKAAGEVDVAIAAVHVGDPQDEEIAEFEGLDLLLGGHSHVFYNKVLGPRSVQYGKAGCWAQVLGMATLNVTEHGTQVSRSELVVLADPDPDDPDPESVVTAVFNTASAQIKRQFPHRFRPVARLPKTIGGWNRVRAAEVPIGRLVAETMLDWARDLGDQWVHFAFINGGNIRAEITGEEGLVLAAHLHAVLPYSNRIVIADAQPDTVRLVLGNFIACAREEPQGFLQFAGIRFRVDAGGAIQDVQVEVAAGTWRPLGELDILRMATIAYLACEDGHHYGFLNAHVIATGQRIDDAWIEALERLTSPDGTLPELRAPSGQCLTFDDEDSFLHVEKRKFLTMVDAAVDGRLAWLRDRL